MQAVPISVFDNHCRMCWVCAALSTCCPPLEPLHGRRSIARLCTAVRRRENCGNVRRVVHTVACCVAHEMRTTYPCVPSGLPWRSVWPCPSDRLNPALSPLDLVRLRRECIEDDVFIKPFLVVAFVDTAVPPITGLFAGHVATSCAATHVCSHFRCELLLLVLPEVWWRSPLGRRYLSVKAPAQDPFQLLVSAGVVLLSCHFALNFHYVCSPT